MDESHFKVKVVEKAGVSLRSMLQKSDISGVKTCVDPGCVVCSTSEKGCCWKESVGYEISCKNCSEGGERFVYLGETGRTAAIRCREHIDDVNKRKGSLWPHCREKHDSQPVEFKCEVVGSFRNPLERQLNEAWRIRNEDGVVLNSKDEWVAPADYSVRVERGID